MHHRFRFRFLLPVVSALALLAAAAVIGAGMAPTSAQTPSPSPGSSPAATSSSGGTATSGTPTASSTGVPSEVSQNADQWPLANADYSNTRSATGSSINASNVGKLGVAWTFKIPAGTAQFGSAASNPIISGNTVYLQDLSSNVYAFDLQTGKMKWKKDFNQPASGPNGPGVAYGKVFVALNDGSIAALDANTGNQLWQTKLARSSTEGITIQVTPYDNQLYVSTVPGTGQSFYKGGDTGVLYGLDQATGKVLWHFDTVDSQNIWGNPNVNSGGGTWYPPAIDTQTGQSFWGIGNPAPFPGTKEFPNGSSRPGQNLYTDSIVSLAPETTAGVQPAGTPAASGTSTTQTASNSGTPSSGGTGTTPTASDSSTPSTSGTGTTPTASDSSTPSSGGTGTTPTASDSSTPSSSGTATTPSASSSGTPSSSGPGLSGNATVAPTTGTPAAAASGTPTAAATPPSPNCGAASVEGGGALGAQGSSNSNTSKVPLQGSAATLAWYKQVKPHDLFDLDFQMSPILTKATINGQQRNVVIGGGKGGYVVAFDQKTGDILWYVAVGQHMNENLQTLPKDSDVKVMPGPLGGIETPMAYANGIVYVPVNNLAAFYTACGLDTSKLDFSAGTGELVALDVNTGQFLWDQQLPSANYGAATVVNDVVFTTTFDGTVYGFNAKTGDQVYKAQLPAGINGWPAVSGDTIIFPAGVGGTPSLVALRIGAGNPLPTPVAKATATGTPAAGAGGAATTPSAMGSMTPGASGTATPATSGTPSGATASGASLTVVAQNIAFDKTTLTAPAGEVTVTFENKDQGIPHNIHFFQGDTASGTSVATTAIKPGPATETLTMNLKPGTYYYQCDVHPQQMHGTLTVQ